jgi:hypothetical protein
MNRHTIHVQRQLNDRSSADRALFRTLAVPRRGMLFPEIPRARRQYPRELEGSYLASYVNGLTNKARKAFLELLVPLWKVERVRNNQPVESFTRRDVMTAYARLKHKIDRRGAARITSYGLVIPPSSSEGKASLAALLLHEDWLISRLRQCLHCQKWFYARVERKKSCSTRCQENHYHSPEWRKKNRERNLRDQREFRKRLNS